MSLILSHHAKVRQQQRGINSHLVALVLAHHDVDLEAGGGCRILRVSRRTAVEALTSATRQEIEQLARLAVVFSETTGQVVTLLHDQSGARGRRYRRQCA